MVFLVYQFYIVFCNFLTNDPVFLEIQRKKKAFLIETPPHPNKTTPVVPPSFSFLRQKLKKPSVCYWLMVAGHNGEEGDLVSFSKGRGFVEVDPQGLSFLFDLIFIFPKNGENSCQKIKSGLPTLYTNRERILPVFSSNSSMAFLTSYGTFSVLPKNGWSRGQLRNIPFCFRSAMTSARRDRSTEMLKYPGRFGSPTTIFTYTVLNILHVEVTVPRY